MTTDLVERKGRVFKFGSYPDQKFSLTSAEFLAANAETREVPVGIDPIGLKHYVGKKNVFDGMLGNVANFAVNGPYLDADFRLAPILLAAVEKEGLKMSAVFSRSSKKLLHVDFTDAPIVSDAALFADDPDAVAIFAEAAFAGPHAVPAMDPEEAAEGEGTSMMMALVMQHLHDVAASAYPVLCMPNATFAHPGEGPRKHMALIHSMTKTHGAKCSAKGNARFSEEGDRTVDDITTTTNASAAVDAAAFATLQAKIDELQARSDKAESKAKGERDRRIAAEAVGFARDNADKLTPPAQALFSGLLQTLANDDEASEGVVGFAYGKDNAESFNGSRVDLLKAAVAHLRPHGLGVEKTTSPSQDTPVAKPTAVPGVVTFAADDTPAIDPSQPTPDGKVPTPARLEYLNGLATGKGRPSSGFGPLPGSHTSSIVN